MISGQGFFLPHNVGKPLFCFIHFNASLKNLENSLAHEVPGDFYGGAKNLKIANCRTRELKSTGSYLFCIQSG